MAKQEYLDILAQGVDAWNQWKQENDDRRLDLTYANLRESKLMGANFQWADLSEADFSRADLKGANLGEAGLVGVNFSHANLREADLRESALMAADLSHADLSQAVVSQADLSEANLSHADLRMANFSGSEFFGTDFSDAKLMGADLSGADLFGADLSGADLTAADLSDADLRRADLRRADFFRADFSGANLFKANLTHANLNHADLSGANLSEADLSHANLSEANLDGADLGQAVCKQADFSKADLVEVRLIDADLNGATLSGACLWETQRAGWTIKGVICTHVHWDIEGKEIATFGPGDFERLYSEKSKVLVKYPGGISPLEIVTLPALIQHLESCHPGCKLRFESIQDAPGGAFLTIVVEDEEHDSPEQVERLRAAIQLEAEKEAQYLRRVLEGERQTASQLKGAVESFEWVVKELLSHQKPTIYITEGDAIVGDTYKTGQAGAVGPNAHAHDMMFNQIGGQIEQSMDLSQLAVELSKLRQAMSQEAKEPNQYIALGEVAAAEEAAKAKDSSKVAERLKGVGKWALDFATKIGASLAAEAIERSTGTK